MADSQQNSGENLTRAGARIISTKDHISLDYFVALAVEERVAALRAMAFLDQRADHGSPAKLKKILRRAPDVEPEPMDQSTP